MVFSFAPRRGPPTWIWGLCAIVGGTRIIPLERYQSFADSEEASESPKPTIPNDDSRNKRSSPCEKYNNVLERLVWTERRKRCNVVSGCTFVGRSFTGTCIPLEQTTEESHERDDEIDNISKRVWEATDIDSSFRNSQNIAAGIAKQMVVGSAVDSAVESLRDSQQLANEIAKDLILELLRKKENQGILGQFLQYIFAYETVLAPTRELVYWSLAGKDCTNNLTALSNRQRDYWLAKPPKALAFDYHLLTNTRDYQVAQSMIGAGRANTEANLLWLADWWLRDKGAKDHTVKPLLDWSLKLEEEVIKPLTVISAKTIPYNKDATVQGIIYAVTESLNSEDVRKAAADGVLSYLKRLSSTAAAAGSAVSSNSNSSNSADSSNNSPLDASSVSSIKAEENPSTIITSTDSSKQNNSKTSSDAKKS